MQRSDEEFRILDHAPARKMHTVFLTKGGMKMKIVKAPDSFKESMSALEAADAMEKGF
jgi:hypothetical protein